jgi:hypothetical protein
MERSRCPMPGANMSISGKLENSFGIKLVTREVLRAGS